MLVNQTLTTQKNAGWDRTHRNGVIIGEGGSCCITNIKMFKLIPDPQSDAFHNPWAQSGWTQEIPPRPTGHPRCLTDVFPTLKPPLPPLPPESKCSPRIPTKSAGNYFQPSYATDSDALKGKPRSIEVYVFWSHIMEISWGYDTWRCFFLGGLFSKTNPDSHLTNKAGIYLGWYSGDIMDLVWKL